MHPEHHDRLEENPPLDGYTTELLTKLAQPLAAPQKPDAEKSAELRNLFERAMHGQLTAPIIRLFDLLLALHREGKGAPADFGISGVELERLAIRHQQIDEHMVSVGGRLTRALPIAAAANQRVDQYLAEKDILAPSGIELWEKILGH